MGRKIGYVRDSSKGQIEDRQVEELVARGIDREDILVEKQSGKNFDRPLYQSLKVGIGRLKEGDELWVHELSRFGRNKEEMKNELKFFKEKGVIVRILDIPTTLAEFEGVEWVRDMVNNILIEVLGAQAEQERLYMLKRQKEAYDVMKRDSKGRLISKRTNRPVGRKEIGFPSDWESVYSRWESGEITAVSAMKELNLTKSTFYNLVKKYKAKNEGKANE